MKNNNFYIITGQSGVSVKECIGRINKQYIIPDNFLSIEKIIEDSNNISFIDFLEQNQNTQKSYWKEAFDKFYKKYENLEKEENVKSLFFLNLHSVYYHQKKREFFSPIDFSKMTKIKGKVKCIITLIDDIYDVYRRLMYKDQMYFFILNKNKTKPSEAILLSVFNLVILMIWREFEISLSKSLADFLGAKFFLVSTKHPAFMIKRIFSNPLDELNFFYLSHHITTIRRQSKTYLPPFPGQLQTFIEEIINSNNRIVLFYPTTIDELRIRKEKKDGKEMLYPELSQRWPHPFEDKMISPGLRGKFKNINPLNPQNYSLENDEKTSFAVSFLLKFLAGYIYEKQILSRDYTLIDQSKSGIIVCRPLYQGEGSDGVSGEYDYNFSITNKKNRRKCFIFSSKEDFRKNIIYRLFATLRLYLEEECLKNLSKRIDEMEDEWIEKGIDINNFKNSEELEKELNDKLLGKDYDFKDDLFKSSQYSAWKGGPYIKRRDRQKNGFKIIFEQIRIDEISEEARKELEKSCFKQRFHYNIYDDSVFWNEAKKFLKENLNREKEG